MQSGIGRTGHWFASAAAGVRPDVLTLAKGLGGGLPIGACIGVRPGGRGCSSPAQHGSTFGGNPVALRGRAGGAAHASSEDGLLEHVRRMGERLAAGLRGLASPLVAGVRGSGLLVGAGADAARWPAPVEHAGPRARACWSTRSRPTSLRLAPPLIVTEAEIAEAVGILPTRWPRSRASRRPTGDA